MLSPGPAGRDNHAHGSVVPMRGDPLPGFRRRDRRFCPREVRRLEGRPDSRMYPAEATAAYQWLGDSLPPHLAACTLLRASLFFRPRSPAEAGHMEQHMLHALCD